MKKILTCIGIAILVIVFISWGGIWFTNQVGYVNQKIDDATNYETRKNVEDSCRAMIASYEADKFTWGQYKDSESAEQVSWANQAKMRANRTAANYNNYILKNSFVWSENIPNDILSELTPIE